MKVYKFYRPEVEKPTPEPKQMLNEKPISHVSKKSRTSQKDAKKI